MRTSSLYFLSTYRQPCAHKSFRRIGNHVLLHEVLVLEKYLSLMRSNYGKLVMEKYQTYIDQYVTITEDNLLLDY